MTSIPPTIYPLRNHSHDSQRMQFSAPFSHSSREETSSVEKYNSTGTRSRAEQALRARDLLALSIVRQPGRMLYCKTACQLKNPAVSCHQSTSTLRTWLQLHQALSSLDQSYQYVAPEQFRRAPKYVERQRETDLLFIILLFLQSTSKWAYQMSPDETRVRHYSQSGVRQRRGRGFGAVKTSLCLQSSCACEIEILSLLYVLGESIDVVGDMCHVHIFESLSLSLVERTLPLEETFRPIQAGALFDVMYWSLLEYQCSQCSVTFRVSQLFSKQLVFKII